MRTPSKAEIGAVLHPHGQVPLPLWIPFPDEGRGLGERLREAGHSQEPSGMGSLLPD